LRSSFTIIVVFIWAAVALGLITYFATQKISDFDPNGMLTKKMNKIESDSQFRDKLRELGFTVEKGVFHFSKGNCYCNFIASPHINSVNSLVLKKGYKNVQVNISAFPTLSDYIPSTPAIAVFNETGALAYLGPYSSGLYCAPTEGLVEKFIPAENNIIGAVIVTDARGCYCSAH